MCIRDSGYIPVVAPIGIDQEQAAYNINADLVAAAIAVKMNADKLVLLTDVPGLLKNPQDSNTLISELKVSEVEGYIPVSYTHLDVYKRQLIWLWVWKKPGVCYSRAYIRN